MTGQREVYQDQQREELLAHGRVLSRPLGAQRAWNSETQRYDGELIRG